MSPAPPLSTIQDYLLLMSGLRKLSPQNRRERIRQLCLHDLYFLLAFVLRRRDARNPQKADWLIARCKEVQNNPNGYLDLWAREHYKSTIITFALTIQDILKDQELTIGIFSHTRPIAKSFLIQIKRELEDNGQLKWLFPEILYENPKTESPKWSEDTGIVVKRKGNPKEATVEAWGLVDGQPTSKHYDRRIYDDTVTLESVNTPDQIEKTTKAWEMSDNLGKEGGYARYIGTRYSLFDTYSEMMKRDAIIVRKYAATHNGRLDGKPVLFTQEYWAAKLKTQSRRTLASQHMQNPMADSDAVFVPLWLRSYEIRPRLINIVIMVDPSKGKRAKNDNTAIAVVAIAASNKRYLVDGYCHRMTLSQRWTAIRDLHKKWSAMPGVQSVHVGNERYGQQTDDEYYELKMIEEKYPITIKELNWVNEGSQSKTHRVERLEPDFRNSRFFLPLSIWREGQPMTWRVDDDPQSDTYQQVMYSEFLGPTAQQLRMIEGGSPDLMCRAIKRLDQDKQAYDLTLRFIEEFLSFPFGEHDDLIDATSRLYDMDVTAPVYMAPGAGDPTVYHDS